MHLFGYHTTVPVSLNRAGCCSTMGILSTERGQRALQSFDSYERSLLEVHSKGVNSELVQKSLLDLERKFKDGVLLVDGLRLHGSSVVITDAEAISLEKSNIWDTGDKTFERWISPLVYALIGYCDDIVPRYIFLLPVTCLQQLVIEASQSYPLLLITVSNLFHFRLCQEIVFMKAEVAELLMPNVVVNLAGRKALDMDLRKLIALKVQESIFVESNKLIKSIKVILDALNELRLCHVLEITASSVQSKRESSKDSIAELKFSVVPDLSIIFPIYWVFSYLLCGLVLEFDAIFCYLLLVGRACKLFYDATAVSYTIPDRPMQADLKYGGTKRRGSSKKTVENQEREKFCWKIDVEKSELTISQINKMILQFAKTSSYNPRSRSTPLKLKDLTATSTELVASKSMWDKVYWLPIDYLVVAKSAITCGSYFTAILYVEHWCEEHFKSLVLGSRDFSLLKVLPQHVEILVSAVTQINEPDSLYGIIQSNKLSSQIVTFEHEGNWGKALEYFDLQARSEAEMHMGSCSKKISPENSQQVVHLPFCTPEEELRQRKPYKGLIRSLQQIGCTHVLDLYCQGLSSRKGRFQHDSEFVELQYEAAWRAGNWDFSLLHGGSNSHTSSQYNRSDHFNENLHSCLRALQEGDFNEFHMKLKNSKQELLLSICHASEESTEYLYSTVVKLQIFYHLGIVWDLRWTATLSSHTEIQKLISEPLVPCVDQLSLLNMEWSCILKRAQLHMNLLEPFIAFRRVLLQVLSCVDCTAQHLVESSSILRKGSRFSQAAASLHEFKFLCKKRGEEHSNIYWLGRVLGSGWKRYGLPMVGSMELINHAMIKEFSDRHTLREGSPAAGCLTSPVEEAKLLRAQGQHEMAINLANSRTILEKYLKHAVTLAEDRKATDKKSIARRSQTHFHLAHYADALFRSYEERLNSNEWQATMRLRKHKGEKTDYSVKIQELQKQLAMDREEAEKLQQDRDNFLSLALEGYKHCLVIGDKYDVRVVFRLVSLWFSFSTSQIVVNAMLSTIEEVQSHKFIPLVYQIASRMGSAKDGQGPAFQFALISLVKKMAIDHPYHTIFQLLALANGDRVKDKQCSRNSFFVDMDKKCAAENLLMELSSYHGTIIGQMRHMVEIYIKLAELETKREDTNRRINLPREIRSVRRLELVPVVTSSFPIDLRCQYHEGSFPHFRGLEDSVMVMNGINAPKVVECLGSDGNKYRQLAKSGNDDLRQDAVMEQFFALVNTFLQNHRGTWKRRLGVRTYKVVPFTPSAGVLEWVNGTIPLGDYLIGSMRNGGAHGRYGVGDWTFAKSRQHMATENNKRKAFREVCANFRPVMHHFFLERFLCLADWFEKRLAYTRSVAASSMVGYIFGLGDRHSINILIDQATAEVVHIDLGVAFEQGLMLKTPEWVFIHDPLYKWALSPLKALQRQKETDDDLDTSLEESQDEYEGNKDAARALLRVKRKLDGYEEGEMRSVHGQVDNRLLVYSDSDWAGDPTDRTSTTGYVTYLGSTPISWCSKKQRSVSRSSTEAKYRAVAAALAETNWLTNLLRELRFPLKAIPRILCDNVGTTYICENPVFHSKMKHIAIDFHFVRDQVQRKEVEVKHLHSADQVADVLTKPLPRASFSRMFDKLGVTDIHTNLRGRKRDRLGQIC
ncbi:hypothetical protein RJ639_019504 [Escallonia herrerae]|uniref:Serine/threonine-protein kinase ATM n=1 Tax=Escallonia herrerae TaxID=1293975 RepID=A0AA88V9U8_9ASTE|nr:hypothetical protein RJ639_019504 [Escallonia herrerae]